MSWPAPVFVHGQIISAEAHLNRLQGEVNDLAARLLTFQVPFCGSYLPFQTTDLWTYLGYIRHRSNTFVWRYALKEGSARITYNGQELANTVQFNPSSTFQEYSGTEDLSDLGLEEGEFYPVNLECTSQTGEVLVWLMAEVTEPSLAEMASFQDETTPSADEWNVLSSNADNLDALLRQPISFGNASLEAGISPSKNSFPYRWVGMAKRYNQYLRINGELFPPYNRPDPEEGGIRYYEARIYINDVLQEPVERKEIGSAADARWYPFTRDIDLEAAGVGVGDWYKIRVDFYAPKVWDDYGRGRINSVYELPDTTVTISGWNAMPTWEVGDWVYGSTGSPRVKYIRDNLALLGELALGINPVCAKSRQRAYSHDNTDPAAFPYQIHRYRWLHYWNFKTYEIVEYNDEGEIVSKHEVKAQPALIYYPPGEEPGEGETYEQGRVVVSLPNSEGEWKVYDLSTIERLRPGMIYYLRDIYWACEDFYA